ncbi:MAG: hypothetical protein WC455_09150 [Dehalococcoidia bacterium]|jgi:hypothetical protein
MKIFTGTVSHKHGTDTYISATEQGVNAKIYDYVVREWDDAFPGVPIPENPDLAISYYFNNCQEAGVEDNSDDIGPTDIKAKLHCIVIDDPDAGNGPDDGYRVFLGQTREEALDKAFEYMAENIDEDLGHGDIGAMSPEKKLRILKHVYGSPFDGEVEV